MLSRLGLVSRWVFELHLFLVLLLPHHTSKIQRFPLAILLVLQGMWCILVQHNSRDAEWVSHSEPIFILSNSSLLYFIILMRDGNGRNIQQCCNNTATLLIQMKLFGCKLFIKISFVWDLTLERGQFKAKAEFFLSFVCTLQLSHPIGKQTEQMICNNKTDGSAKT